MRYEIDKDNAIRVYNDSQKVPFALQPNWPDGTPWANYDEAKEWAELLIESMTDKTTKFLPGISPDTHPELRPEPVEIDPETGMPVEPTDLEA